MKKYLSLMRVHHYIKNVLIFFPLFFGRQLLDTELFFKTLYGFISFCFIASAVYIINDIRDADFDRQHSTKRMRPIASGAVAASHAMILACILLLFALFFNYLSAGVNHMTWIYLSAYFMLNFGYSMGLKNIPIIDIAILASGFLLRVLYGSSISGIDISKWLYLTVISVSFYLGLGKRKNELIGQCGSSRRVLQFYNHNFLDKNMYMCLALTIAFYSLWSVDSVTVARISNSNLIWTVPLVFLISLRYSLKIEGESEGDPVEVVLRDKMLIIMLAVFVLCSVWIIYF